MPSSRRSRPRRTWPQRLVITFTTLAVLAAAVTAGSLAYANRRLGEIDRIALGESLRNDELSEGDAQNYLIVGIDDASGLDQGDSVRNRDSVIGLKTDTIMVLRVDPKGPSAQILSFPRDLWVPIAGTDTNQRINTALETGGPARLIETIDQNFGIPIHHYVQIDFADFRELVSIVGGVPVYFPRPARARSSGLSIEEAGCYTLGPVQALGFARARKDYLVQDDDGDWHVDLGGDYSRVARQQLFVELALRRAITKGARNPNTLRRLVDLGVETVTVDDSLDGDNLVNLGTRFRSFDPADLERHTLPTTEDTVGEAQVLFLKEEEAEPTLAIFRGVAPAPAGSVSPEDVTVQVLNGTGAQGQGGEVTDALVAAGFEAAVPADSDAQGEPTKVRYVAGGEAKAQLVARYIAGPVLYEPVLALDGVDVQLVTGSDWFGTTAMVRPVEEVPPPATTAPSTTTTAPGSGQTTVTTVPGGTNGVEEGDPNDPDDPLFYRASAPPPGSSCPITP